VPTVSEGKQVARTDSPWSSLLAVYGVIFLSLLGTITVPGCTPSPQGGRVTDALGRDERHGGDQPLHDELRLLEDPQPLETILLSTETRFYSAFTLTFEVLPDGVVGGCSVSTARNGTAAAKRFKEAVCASVRQRVYAPIHKRVEIRASFTTPHL